MAAEAKQIEDNRHIEKVKEARASLRGASSNIETVIDQSARMSRAMEGQAAALNRTAANIGEGFYVEVLVSGTFEKVSLKRHLQMIAGNLTKEVI